MYDRNGDYFGGYVRNEQHIDDLIKSLPHPGPLFQAAPDFQGDGDNQDLMPYKALYEIEILNPDGTVWKKKGDEPPYINQTGNNCTSEGEGHVIDMLQAIDIADPVGDEVPVFQRTCIEACYAFGLYKAGMRGDNGCSGAGMAQAAYEIGVLSYYDIAPPYDETASRLRNFANNPKAVVSKYGAIAASRKLPAPVQITNVAEAQAWIANRGFITIASDKGFATPRDDKGICQQQGVWKHQMALTGRIVSDGIPTFVVFQSWGPNQPNGPTPFQIPSFSFRALDKDIQAILNENDCWGFRSFPGFKKTPLPSKWTYVSWG